MVFKCSDCGYVFTDNVYIFGKCIECEKDIFDTVLTNLPSGSGFNYEWMYKFQKDSIKFISFFEVYNENGFSLGGYPIAFTYYPNLKDFKVFCSKINRVSYGFSEYFEEILVDIILILGQCSFNPIEEG